MSKSSEESQIPGIPVALARTTLPKETLSFRWVINNAKIFLKNALNSPEFSVTSSSQETTTWRLSISAWGNKIAMSLNVEVTHALSKILISGCKFSILNYETSEIKHCTTVPDKEFEHRQSQLYYRSRVSDVQKEYCSVVTSKLDAIDKYLCDDTLVIQVDATLFFISSPIEVSDEIPRCRVPLDNIRQEMYSLVKNEVLTDVVINCDDKEFKSHRVVLASQSPVFKKMLEVDMQEKSSSIIKIVDISATVMSDLLDYFYTGSAPNLNSLAEDLLNAANKYELPRLLAMCENALISEIGIANAIDMLQLADLHNAIHLKKACLNYIRLNSAKVNKTESWQYLKDNVDKHSSLFLEMMETSTL